MWVVRVCVYAYVYLSCVFVCVCVCRGLWFYFEYGPDFKIRIEKDKTLQRTAPHCNTLQHTVTPAL